MLDRNRRELQTIVQSALSHTAQTARQSFTDANEDIVKAVAWTSTLDSKTSEICRIRDKKQYTPDSKHKPIGHKIPWLQGPGRSHMTCRSTSTPVVKSWQELGINAADMPAGTRASMDGQVPAETTYAQWFARQSAARQDEIVGTTRGALFRKGELAFDKFYDDRGTWLSIEELRAKVGL